MGSRMRTPQTRNGTQPNIIGDDIRTPLTVTNSLPPPPPFLPLSASVKQLVMSSGTGGELLGFQTVPSSSLDIIGGGPSSSTTSKELRRIGKIRMLWEESVSL
ncbi:hypothetical protein RDI58_007821 [Solanum bulbocastanum]|uniref:Uncharacterized protein n=1 Tax=Solanum bulbocastanum TaxID=147425 RepID=A0AAN8YMJ1_SOLBU